MKNRFFFTLFILLLSRLYAAEGVIPSLTYSAEEQWEIISPQMSDKHMNQPSVFNGYAILAGNAEHEVWDISNPYAPVLKAEMLSNHASGGEAESHQVTYARAADGTYYLATISGVGIDIWDVTNTISPTYISELALPGINYGDVTGGVWGVCWQGDYLYVGATTIGLYVVDVSDPENPTHVATITRSELGGVTAGPLFALGDLLVITPPKGHNGIATVDISNPLAPRLLDSDFSFRSTYIGSFYGSNAYMINPIRAFDVVTDPTNIVAFGATDVPSSEYVSFSNNYLYLGGLRGGTQGIYKYDITDPENPSLIGRVEGRDSSFDDQFSCPIGNLLIVADDQRSNGQYVGAVIAVHESSPDVTGISVMEAFPQNGKSNQSLSGQVAISFSEWPEFASVNPSSFILRPIGGDPLIGTWGCSYTTLTFSPEEPLLPLTAYEIVLPADGITDLVGNAISEEFTSTFSTGEGIDTIAIDEVDETPPTELGNTTTFSIKDPDTNREYTWEFGDSSTASGSSVNYNYSTPGRYNVIMKSSLSDQISHEAETATLNGPHFANNNNGYSGSGFADFPAAQGVNVYIEWTITEETNHTADIGFRYALGASESRPLELVVNGVSLGILNLVSTNQWNNWEDYIVSGVTLNQGENIIRLQASAGSSGPNIDRLYYERPQGDIQQEAEGAILSQVSISSSNSGHSGTGYIDYPSSQGADVSIDWVINVAVNTSRDLIFRYALGSTTPRPLELFVNDISYGNLDLSSTGSWSTWEDYLVESVNLSPGPNMISLRATAGSPGPNIDHLRYNNDPEDSIISTTSFLHIVHRPLTETSPSSSQAMILDEETIFSIHSDANSISAFNIDTLTKLFESPVGQHPVALAKAPNGNLWVLNRDSYSITILSNSGQTLDTLSLPYASQPSGLVFLPDSSAALISLKATGHILKLDPNNGTILDTITLPEDTNGLIPMPEGIAVSADSSTAYVTRSISPDTSGIVYQIDLNTFTLTANINLSYDVGIDTSQFSRGLPNYLHSLTISPDGERVWIPSKKDNIERGTARDGLDIGHDVTVRAINSVINTATNTELLNERTDVDNSDRIHSVSFSPLGDLGFATLPGNDRVVCIDAYSNSVITSIETKEAPIATVYHEATGRIAILNFLGRSLSIYNISSIFNGETSFIDLGTYNLVNNEPLSAEVLHGKKLFYSAGPQFNQSGYMSCASCHIDGTHDGRTYDFTSLGEGFRNTIDLKGKSGTGHGRIHWSANFDEIHDFENQIRTFGGAGLMEDDTYYYGSRSDTLGLAKSGVSDDLDALSSYVQSLNSFAPSPYRNDDESLTNEAIAGKAIFQSANCASCHGGEEFTDSRFAVLHDVGTLSNTSGTRLNNVLTGLDTPTLRGLWRTAPYLHDGSAPTLYDVLVTKNPNDQHGVTSNLTQTELDNLIAYLLQIDASEPSAPEPNSPSSNTFTNFINSYGLTGNDADPNADPDADSMTNFEEFSFGGTDPTSAAASAELIAQISPAEGGNDHFTLSLPVPSGGTWSNGTYKIGDNTYTPIFSYDLTNWNLDYTVAENPDNGLPDTTSGYQWISFRILAPISDNSQSFGRLLVE